MTTANDVRDYLQDLERKIAGLQGQVVRLEARVKQLEDTSFKSGDDVVLTWQYAGGARYKCLTIESNNTAVVRAKERLPTSPSDVWGAYKAAALIGRRGRRGK